MHVVERPGELVVRDSPGFHWLLGLMFAGIGGVFVLASLGVASRVAALRAWERALAFVMGALAVAVGLWVFSRSPFSRLRVDRAARRVVLTRVGLRGRREHAWPMTDVSGVEVVESADDEGGEIFQVHLVLRDGQVVPVSMLWLHGRGPVTDAATRLARALDVPYTPAP
jgi:hypothetical protein